MTLQSYLSPGSDGSKLNSNISSVTMLERVMCGFCTMNPFFRQQKIAQLCFLWPLSVLFPTRQAFKLNRCFANTDRNVKNFKATIKWNSSIRPTFKICRMAEQKKLQSAGPEEETQVPPAVTQGTLPFSSLSSCLSSNTRHWWGPS